MKKNLKIVGKFEITISINTWLGEEFIQVNPIDEVIDALSMYDGYILFYGDEIIQGSFQENGIDDCARLYIDPYPEPTRFDKYEVGEYYGLVCISEGVQGLNLAHKYIIKKRTAKRVTSTKYSCWRGAGPFPSGPWVGGESTYLKLNKYNVMDGTKSTYDTACDQQYLPPSNLLIKVDEAHLWRGITGRHMGGLRNFRDHDGKIIEC